MIRKRVLRGLEIWVLYLVVCFLGFLWLFGWEFGLRGLESLYIGQRFERFFEKLLYIYKLERSQDGKI